MRSYVQDTFYAINGTVTEDLNTQIRDVITTVNRGMMGHVWEEFEFRLYDSVRHMVSTFKCIECIRKPFVYVYIK